MLILGDEPRVVVTLARSLHKHGVPADVAMLSEAAPSVSSRAIRSCLRLPDQRQGRELLRTALLALAEVNRYDMLFPASDWALTVTAQNYDELSSLLHVACPPPHIVNRVLIKSLTLEAARASGIAIPTTYPVKTLEDLEELHRELRFPLIAKPRRKMDETPFKLRCFSSYEELYRAFDADPLLGERCLFQEYCPGVGVGIETLLHRGEPLVLFQHRRLKEWPSTGGVSVVAISEPVDPLLAEQAVCLLRALEWEGVAMVEFRRDLATGRTVLMEVNGRYWGSLAVSSHCGVEFPLYEWELAHGVRPHPPSTYRTGLRVRWTSGALLHLHNSLKGLRGKERQFRGRLQTLSGFVSDLAPSTCDALWSLRDPLPFLVETLGTVRRLAREELLAVLRRVLPDAVVRIGRLYRNIGPRPAVASLRAWLCRSVGIGHGGRLPRKVRGIRSVLFVCHGNIIRSPMAAALLQQMLNHAGQTSISVVSAGLHAHPLNGADFRALQVAQEFGISLQHHRAQPLTRELVMAADAIFVMDLTNEAELLARYPDVWRKVYLLGACAGDDGARTQISPELEILDPYCGGVGDIRRCYAVLKSRIEYVAQVLISQQEAQRDAGEVVCVEELR